MISKPPTSKKRILIDKNNANMVMIIAAMAFITVFSIISSRSLLSQRSYKGRVIKEQKSTLNILKANNDAAKKLTAAYSAFVSGTENKIGGNVNGTGEKDGDNGKIVLDALPSKYDFPAVANSLENILLKQNFKITEISGTDDEVNQSAASDNAATIAPIEIPFKISVNGSFEAAQKLMDTFQLSIRPFKVNKLSLDGKDGSLNIIVEGVTYYQPEKAIKITTKVVQ